MFRWMIFILILAPVAHAEIDCNLWHRTDFQEATEGIRNLHQPLSFLSAAVDLSVGDGTNPKRWTKCSGTFVSDSGEILTAGHCLDVCRLGKTPCRFEINGVLQEVEILSAPKCSVNEVNKAYREAEAGEAFAAIKKLCGQSDLQDYAILRPKNPDKLGEFSCLEVAPARPALDSSVFAMGYPTRTERGTWQKAKDAPGGKLMVSSGEVIQSYTCEKIWKPRYPLQDLFHKEDSGPVTMDAAPFAQDMKMIQTTVDVVPGSSGGPLINDRGEIVGVTSFIASGLQTNARECRGGTFFQPVAGIQKNLKKKLAPCRQHKAGAGSAI